MVLVKLGGQNHVPLLQLVFFRQAVPLVMLVVWLSSRKRWPTVQTGRKTIHARRTVIGLVGLFLSMSANQLLSLAEATVFGFTAPIFAVILAATLLREQVGSVRWSAVAVGLGGVIFMASGAGGEPNPLGIACAVGSAMCVALTAIQLRDLGQTEGPMVVVFWYFLFTSIALAPFALATIPLFSAAQWMILLGAGFGTLFVQLCLTASMRFGRVSSVIVMDYAALGWSTLLGWLIFDQLPPPLTWIGAPLIVVAGLVIVLREAQLARQRGAAEPLQAAGPEC
jgi:drug/metabolite transporter (DMT)-like permease